MARPLKEGLDYFPLDIDIFDDDKLFDVQNDYGPLGEVIYLRLLCLIYKEGYFYKYKSLDKLAGKLIKSIGSKWARDKQTVKQVIPFLAECNLFSSELMQENVLTSVSIQRRYLKATERRQSPEIKEYALIDKNGEVLLNAHNNQIIVDNNEVIAYINGVSVCNNPPKERKGESKEDENILSLYNGSSPNNNIKPTLEEIREYCENRSIDINIGYAFYYHHEVVGWNDILHNWTDALMKWFYNDNSNKKG